jgi:hypothetical protein
LSSLCLFFLCMFVNDFVVDFFEILFVYRRKAWSLLSHLLNLMSLWAAVVILLYKVNPQATFWVKKKKTLEYALYLIFLIPITFRFSYCL